MQRHLSSVMPITKYINIVMKLRNSFCVSFENHLVSVGVGVGADMKVKIEFRRFPIHFYIYIYIYIK